jgi:hypothetical protein
MTLRALAGLVALNGAYLLVGSCLLWALRGWSAWREWARLAGLAYLLGIAALGVVWTLLLVLGIPVRAPALVLTAVALAVGGAVAGRARGRRLSGASPALVLTKLSLVSAAGIAAAGVFFEALFRAARLQGLYAYDAWAFWIPKARTIHALGELDAELVALFPNPSYPPLVPLLDVAAFHAMGGVDVVTLHVQYWFYAVGFLAAVAGLLWELVPGWILWPFLLLALVAPRTAGWLLVPQADFLLQFFVCAAVVVGALWLRGPASWHLPAVALLLSAAVLTKREGLLLSAILLVALALASADRIRVTWPRMAVAGLAVGAVALPWRLWVRDRGFPGESPQSLLPDRERVWDSLELSLDVLFDVGLWSLLTVLLVAALAVAVLWGDRRLALYVGLLFAFLVLGGAWVSAVFADLPFSSDEAVNPIVRYTGGIALLGAIGAPLLLAGPWSRSRSPAGEPGR